LLIMYQTALMPSARAGGLVLELLLAYLCRTLAPAFLGLKTQEQQAPVSLGMLYRALGAAHMSHVAWGTMWHKSLQSALQRPCLG
jgi:hypothetical protein